MVECVFSYFVVRHLADANLRGSHCRDSAGHFDVVHSKLYFFRFCIRIGYCDAAEADDYCKYCDVADAEG